MVPDTQERISSGIERYLPRRGSEEPLAALAVVPANARLAARLVARLVGTKTGTPEKRILATDRGRSDEARSRQITMYLLHTSLSLTYSEIACALGRDRTTVSHACRLVEDGRDNGALNAMLCELEGILELIGPLAGFCWSGIAPASRRY